MPPKSNKFRGVTLFRPTKKWRAQISAGGKTTSLGWVTTSPPAPHLTQCVNFNNQTVPS
jgi:hypothetical protein